MPAIPRRSLLLVTLGILAAGCSRTPTGPESTTWRFESGNVQSFSYAAFRSGRACQVYLPPGYATSGRSYPVLYVNDGQAAFEGNLKINRICEDLIRRGEMEPIVVVAIESLPDDGRFVDLAPWPGYYHGPRPGAADLYLQAIRDTLKPEIDRRFRTLRDGRNTGMTGFSLGGLTSAYAGYAYDGTFGRVAAFSPSYWWANDSLLSYARARGRPRGLVRFYEDTGWFLDNWIEPMATIALDQGFVNGVDFMSLREDGAEHDWAAWEHRLPGMLEFLFPPGEH